MEISSILLWNIIMTLVFGPIIYSIRSNATEIKRVDIHCYLNSLECLINPLSVLPRMVVLGVPSEDDLAETELGAGVVQPLNKNATVLPNLNRNTYNQ